MLKKNLPHLVLFFIALIIGYIYSPSLIEGKRLSEHDRNTAIGAQKEANDYLNKTGERVSWSNSMFGGMPTYTFFGTAKGNISTFFRNIEKAGAYPASMLFVLMLGAYFCLIMFGVNPWLSIIGALLYSFASHFFILTQAGHVTKLYALSYLPILIASIYYTYKKNRLIGAALTAIFLSIEISAGHPQITYYGVIALFLFGLVELGFAIKEKTIKPFFISSLYLIIPLLLAVGVNYSYLVTTSEYGKFSTRGANELTTPSDSRAAGLDKGYILDYSYDVTEAFTAFIPRLKGGGMSEPLSESSEAYKELSSMQGADQAKKFIKTMPLYWGSQPIVSGPFYFGAITLFLFVLSLFVVKGREKWWLVSVIILSFLLSLGKFFPALSNFFIDSVPLYNKFRDVKNIVFIQCFALWVLGFLGLNEIFKRNISDKQFMNYLKYSLGISGGIMLAFAIIPSLAGNFVGQSDQQLISSGWPEKLIEALRNDRLSAARIDALRSFMFIALAAGLIFISWKKKIKIQYALAIGAILILADLWPINKKYMNESHFVSKRQAEVPYTPTIANNQILLDKDPNYRVLNIALNPFSDASTSYFHKSIGGYSGAKMKRYQDLIDRQIYNNMQTLSGRFKNIKTEEDVKTAFVGLNALNMLNTRYVIYNPESGPLRNENALGNAWFTPEVKWVNSANEEIDAINKTDVSKIAIVDKRFNNLVSGKNFVADPSASIQLTSYTPEKLKYDSKTNSDQVAVFSEIYYPKGWKAFIDGKETEIFRANYVLRAIIVPAGNHSIEFKFEPQSLAFGNKVSYASSILLLIAIFGVGFIEYKKRKQEK